MTQSNKFSYCANGMLVAATISLCGCVMIPDYENPANKIADLQLEAKNFKRDTTLWKTAVPADKLPKGNWWSIFGDAVLDELIADCDKNNPDIAAAYYNVERARQAAFMTESQLYPHLNSTDYYKRDGRSDNIRPVAVGTYSSWVVGLGTTWDLDLFGRVQSIVIKDRALAQASYDLYCNLMLAMRARVAADYFYIRQCQAEIKLLNETLEVRKKQTEFVNKRKSLKYASNLSLSRAKLLEYEAASQLNAVMRSRDGAVNRLATLVGNPVSRFEFSAIPLEDKFPKVPQAVPSELLERRPDIAAAEREMYAANAQIGSDTAAFFPTVSITGDVGFGANKIDTLLTSSSLAWGVSPQIYVPIFQAGKIYAQKQADIAVYEAMTKKYKSKVLSAIEEVETALSDIINMEAEYTNRKKASKYAAEVQSYTQKQYDLGEEDYFAVSDAQRQYLLYKREEIKLLGARYRSFVSLIMSLGGGWTIDTQMTSKESLAGIYEGIKTKTNEEESNIHQSLHK